MLPPCMPIVGLWKDMERDLVVTTLHLWSGPSATILTISLVYTFLQVAVHGERFVTGQATWSGTTHWARVGPMGWEYWSGL